MTPARPFRAIDALAVIVAIAFVFLLLGLVMPRDLPLHVEAVVGAVATVVGLFGGVWLRRHSAWTVMSPGRFSPALAGWALVGTVGICLVILSFQKPLLDFFPESKQELDRLTRELSSSPVAVLLLLMAVSAPLVEELLFRGVLLRGFRYSWGAVAGLLLSSALFGLAHGVVPRMLITFVVGLWLGALFLKTGGVAIPILAHAGYNGFVLFMAIANWLELPAPFAIPGAAAFLLAAWRLFRPGERSMQGSAPPGAS